MRSFIFLILLTFFISEIQGHREVVCMQFENDNLRFSASEFVLEFKHSVYGGDVALKCRVAGDKIVIATLESKDEASLSYYTDIYEFVGNRFVSVIDEKLDAIVVNEGWKVKFGNQELETRSLTRIFPCG